MIFGQTPKSQRLVFVEEFTQASCGPCAAANPTLNATLSANTSKVVSLKYQTSWPGVDPMNAANPSDVATRVKFYGWISGVPCITKDGDSIPNWPSSYTGYPGALTTTVINTEYAVSSPFTMNLSHHLSVACDSIFITCIINATTAATYSNLNLRVAIAEKEIDFCAAPGSNGEKAFFGVMRKMLPNATGTSLASTWTNNQADTVTFAEALPAYIYDKNQISVVAFIQAGGSGLGVAHTVYQAAFSAPQPLSLDAGLPCGSLGVPSGLTCVNSITPTVTIKNYGTTTLTSATINYKIDASGTYVGYAWSGSLASGSTATATLPTLSVTGGSHTFYASVVSPNTVTDFNAKNDLMTQAFNIGLTSGASNPPVTQSFTASTWPPTGWMNIDVTNDGSSWVRTSTGSGGASTYSAAIAFYSIAAGAVDELYVLPFDLSNASSATLTFNVAYAMYSATESDSISVRVSTDCGSTWDQPYGKTKSALATNGGGYVTSSFIPTTSQWRNESVDLTPWTTAPVVYVKFRARSGYGNNAFIDDINITSVITSVSNPTPEKNIEMFPNPSNGKVSFTGLKNANISIYSLLGSKVMEMNNIDGNQQIDMSNLEGGAYIVKILSGNRIVTKKLVLDK